MKVVVRPVQVLKEKMSETISTVKKGENIGLQKNGNVIGILTKEPIWKPTGNIHFWQDKLNRIEDVPPRTSVWLSHFGAPQIFFNRVNNEDLSKILCDVTLPPAPTQFHGKAYSLKAKVKHPGGERIVTWIENPDGQRQGWYQYSGKVRAEMKLTLEAIAKIIAQTTVDAEFIIQPCEGEEP